jgi:AAA15 family ATPase/GTPase
MKLVRLEVRNYRSIKEQVESDAIVFDGLDCLVGKNNAGKSNILEAVLFFLGIEKSSQDLYYKRDSSLVIPMC